MFMLFQRLTSRGKIYWGSNRKSLLGSGERARFLSTSVVVQRQTRFGKDKNNLLIASLANFVCLATIFCDIEFVFRSLVGGKVSSPWRYGIIMFIVKNKFQICTFWWEFLRKLFFPLRQLTWRNLIFSCFAPPPKTHFSVNSALMVDSRVGVAGAQSRVVGVSRANIFSLLNEEKSFLSKVGMERRENIIEPTRESHCVGLIDQFLWLIDCYSRERCSRKEIFVEVSAAAKTAVNKMSRKLEERENFDSTVHSCLWFMSVVDGCWKTMLTHTIEI